MASAQEGGGHDGPAELIGLETLEIGDGEARGRLSVDDRHRQVAGIVHGGIYSLIAETLSSAATNAAVRDQGMVAMGQANNATFLRPIAGGYVNASARALHRGRTTWVWDVELADDEGRVAALVRTTVAVRPPPITRGSGS
jgi:1,4-dihydroxy-2-naphthoyl-CoA hydrolase